MKLHLAEKKTCTGCTACANICPVNCIVMKPDENGFNYPVIDSTVCISCGYCVRTCPVLKNDSKREKSVEAYAAYSLNESSRYNSSSGGIFSEIAKNVLDKGGAVYGAAYDEYFNVYHCTVENILDLEKLQGSKYAESRLGNVFSGIKNRLDSGQAVLFSGVPCQVAGLKAFLGKDYTELVCIDIVCHSVPSPMVWKRYVEYRAKNDNEGRLPITINLRDKSSGWSRYSYSNVFLYSSENKHSDDSSHSEYMRLFTKNMISRLSCGDCKFKGYSRSSDITLGDFWGIWDIDPEMDDKRGTSVVLIQSEKGRKIWEAIKKHINCKPVPTEYTSQQNPAIIVSSKPAIERDAVLEKIRTNGFDEALAISIANTPLKAKLINKIKSVLLKKR